MLTIRLVAAMKGRKRDTSYGPAGNTYNDTSGINVDPEFASRQKFNEKHINRKGTKIDFSEIINSKCENNV